jgi:hypothetical protein
MMGKRTNAGCKKYNSSIFLMIAIKAVNLNLRCEQIAEYIAQFAAAHFAGTESE